MASLPLPVLYAIAAAAQFGLAVSLTRFALAYMSPVRGALVAIPIVALALWLAAPFALDLAGWHWVAVGIFVVVGVFFPALVTMLMFEANRRIGPTSASTLGGTSPVFALMGGILFLGEPLSPHAIGGTLAVVAGIALISGWGTAKRLQAIDVAIPLGAAFVRGMAQTFVKMGLGFWANTFAATLVVYTVSSFTVLASQKRGAEAAKAGWPLRGVLWFSVVGLLNGAAVYTLYLGLRTGNVSVVSPIGASFPLFALLFSAMISRTLPTPRAVAGALVTVAGVGLIVAG